MHWRITSQFWIDNHSIHYGTTHSCASFGSISKIESCICYCFYRSLDVSRCCNNRFMHRQFSTNSLYLCVSSSLYLCHHTHTVCLFFMAIYFCLCVLFVFVFLLISVAAFSHSMHNEQADWAVSKECLLSFVLTVFIVGFWVSLYFQKESPQMDENLFSFYVIQIVWNVKWQHGKCIHIFSFMQTKRLVSRIRTQSKNHIWLDDGMMNKKYRDCIGKIINKRSHTQTSSKTPPHQVSQNHWLMCISR